VPVFVDIDDTFQIDPQRVREAITPSTRAIIAVHFGGPMADMDALASIAREHGLLLIEDAAHAHGSEWNGKRAGSLGWAGSFSFQNGKVMTAGEGGIVTTNAEAVAESCRSFANQGRRAGHDFFQHFTIASNFRITALQAAVLLAQLERLPEQIQRRAGNAERLQRELAGLPGLISQRVLPAARRHSHYLAIFRVEAARLGVDRDTVCSALQAAGVPCTPFYPHPLYGNIAYQSNPCRVMPCPLTEERIRDTFWLPHRVLLSGEEVMTAIARVLQDLQRRG
jgi:dTDP-4-amino-4,6-dideoxygalactose transaminase